jgi:DNA-binding winged helix-turn-helix (wHTH) protein
MNPQAGSSVPSAYIFADYRLEPGRRSLTRSDGTVLKVSGKPFDVLVYLVRHAGDVVDRSKLLQAVWR